MLLLQISPEPMRKPLAHDRSATTQKRRAAGRRRPLVWRTPPGREREVFRPACDDRGVTTTAQEAFAATALERLRTLTGDDHSRFRPGQLEAIQDVVADRARVLCVQRTGWGKSAVYFVATAQLREAGAGPTLIVSPLLALMRNQIAAAQRLGLRAHTINSTNREEWDDVRDRLAADTIDLLLISPERLNNPRFREDMLPLFAASVGVVGIHA